jgi:hypothetical protein
MDCFASLAMTALMSRPKYLPCLGGAGDLAARLAHTTRDGLDQLAVRSHLLPIGEIEGILQPRAQMTAKIGAALVQRPDFGAADRGDLSARFR